MYISLVCPHLDYCDVIYHIHSKQDQLRVVLNSLMETVEKVQYQAALAVLVHSKVQVVLNWVGSPYLISVGVGRSCRFIRLSIIRHLNKQTNKHTHTHKAQVV